MLVNSEVTGSGESMVMVWSIVSYRMKKMNGCLGQVLVHDDGCEVKFKVGVEISVGTGCSAISLTSPLQKCLTGYFTSTVKSHHVCSRTAEGSFW